jgi:hypothetical protein
MRKITLSILLVFLGLSYNLNAQTDAVLNEDSIKETKLLALPEIRDVAKRIGNKLVISFQNRKISEFEDVKNPEFFEEANGEKSISTRENPETGKIDTTFAIKEFRLIDIVCDNKYYLIQQVESYESEFVLHVSYLLINKKDGEESSLIERPVFSPDNSHFIELFLVVVDGNEPELKVSKVSYDGKIVVEFSMKENFETPRYWESATWINNNEFNINMTNGEKPIAPVKYKFNGIKWVLATARPAKKPAPAVKKK